MAKSKVSTKKKANRAKYKLAYRKLAKTHKPLFVFLPKAEYRAVKAIAKKREMSVAKLVRSWIKRAA